MGWGINNQTDQYGQDIMKQVIMRQADRKQCENQIKATERISKTWILDNGDICATALKKNNSDNALCKGDGGGPLICREKGTDRLVHVFEYLHF